MKDFFKNVKELWANRRYRALIILGGYVIFFVVVFIVFNNFNKQSINIPVTGLDLFKQTKNYSYTILEENLEYRITDDKINYEDIIYPLNKLPEELNKYDIDYFTPNNIYNLIKNSILESTNYLEKTDIYLIDMDNINTDTISKKEYGKFRITIYKDEENISKIVIDLIDYNGYKYMIMV